MYQCSQALNTSQLDVHSLRHVLRIVYEHEAASYLELTADDNWCLQQGKQDPQRPLGSLPVNMQDNVRVSCAGRVRSSRHPSR